jgi:hypothetical protein
MAMSPEARDLMAGAYSTRESVGMTIDQILTAKVLSPKDREQVIEDSLRGAPQAKAAWPRSTSLEDITRNVAAINVPMVVIAGELDRVDSVGLLKAELLSRISARRPLRLAGYRPSLAAGVSAGAWSTDRRLRRCTSGRRAEQDGRQNEAVGPRRSRRTRSVPQSENTGNPPMAKTTPQQNKALVLEAFDTLFNKRDYTAAKRYWSDRYIQHMMLCPWIS